jgi:7-cyano-7-deazaguanine reductase
LQRRKNKRKLAEIQIEVFQKSKSARNAAIYYLRIKSIKIVNFLVKKVKCTGTGASLLHGGAVRWPYGYIRPAISEVPIIEIRKLSCYNLVSNYIKRRFKGMKNIGDINPYSGRQSHIRNMKIAPGLEVIENIYPDRDYVIELKTNELTTVCPKTGLPDFANLCISYIPDKVIVEEKSLKLYITAYRNIGIFQENATNKILDDFIEAVKPRWVKIAADWNNRGGIEVHIDAEWKKEK